MSIDPFWKWVADKPDEDTRPGTSFETPATNW